mgnify:CR=1 FL=1
MTSTAVTPEEFLRRLSGWARGTMIESHGTRFVSVGRAARSPQLDFTPALAQLTGRFHAGAIIALADETATCAAMWETNPSGTFRPELFPSPSNYQSNLIRNTGQGTLTAEAQIVHRGRNHPRRRGPGLRRSAAAHRQARGDSTGSGGFAG